MARAKSPLWAGIRRRGAGWQAYITVAGVDYTHPFPADTPPRVMQDWRQAQKARHVPSRAGTFAADVDRYLTTVRHMPTFAERKRHLDEWLDALGHDRRRSTITSTEIAAVLSQWLTEPRPRRAGPGQRKGQAPRTEPLGPVTVRHRRTALRHLFRTLDGRSAPNPVDDTPRPKDPAPEPQAIPLDQLARVLRTMRPSASRARVMVLLATGLPPAALMALRPADVDAEQRVARVPARRKGAGTAARRLHLTDAALAAFRELDAWEAWGRFSTSSLLMALARACAAAGVPRFNPYRLRHTAGTLHYQASGDLASTARMLGHSTTAITARYTQEAHVDVDRIAQEKVGARLSSLLSDVQTADRDDERER